MIISHLILVEIDTDSSTIALKIKDLKSLKFDYYSRSNYIKSFAICTHSKHLALSIKSGLEALILDDMINDSNKLNMYANNSFKLFKEKFMLNSMLKNTEKVYLSNY